MNIEKKSCNLELKSIDEEQGIVTFYFSTFGIADAYNDIVMPGAFTKTIKENFNRIRHFKNHQKDKLVGKILSIGVDDIGAFAVSKISKNTIGTDALIEYKEGIMNEHSMGFQAIKSTIDKITGARIITELKLWEVSSVSSWAVNKDALLIDLKSTNDLETEIIELKANNLALEQKLNDALSRADSFTPIIEPLNLDVVKQQLNFN